MKRILCALSLIVISSNGAVFAGGQQAVPAAARAAESLDALQRAASLRPDDPAVQFGIAQCYSVLGEPDKALDALNRALALDPGQPDYLLARAQVHSWLGNYRLARADYARVAADRPDDPTPLIGLARTAGWSGDTDYAARAYANYLRLRPDDRQAWLESARVETWRGNFGTALRLLKQYRASFGDTAEYRQELAETLAKAGRGKEAREIIAPLIEADPNNSKLQSINTLALTSDNRRRDAIESLAALERTQPPGADAQGVAAVVRGAFGGFVQPGGYAYADSDGMQAVRASERTQIPLIPETRLLLGVEAADMRAKSGSPLAPLGLGGSTRYGSVSVGISQWLGPHLEVAALSGASAAGTHQLVPYAGRVTLSAPGSLEVRFEHQRGFFVISPRTVDMGLEDRSERASMIWNPTLWSRVEVTGGYHTLSDGNRRWEASASALFGAARGRWVNFDLGFAASRFGNKYDLDNGYYDPAWFESYSLVLAPYLKTSANTGFSVWMSIGAQRAAFESGFKPGVSAAFQSVIGIQSAWALLVDCSFTANQRLASGAYRGVSGNVSVRRRF